jgi:anti-sigma factor RsiW
MDCSTSRDLLAAWLDGELAPSARTLLERHLDTCPACAALGERLANQDLTPPAPHPANTSPEFWAPLEHNLDHAWADTPTATAPAPPWWQRRIALPAPLLAIQAALLLLGAGWALAHTHGDDVAIAAGEAADAAHPQLVVSQAPPTDSLDDELKGAKPPSWPVAAYTPHRGVF